MTVQSESTWVNQRIPRLYGDHCLRLEPGGDIGETADLVCEQVWPESPVMRLGGTHAHEQFFPNPQEALTPLREKVQAALVRDESRSLMLHAAALERNGRVLLVPASSGSGKTTLAAWLLGHGYRLLSDELVAIDAIPRASGFRQALNVKTPGIPLVAGWPWLAAAMRSSVATPRGLLLPWRGHAGTEPGPISELVFPSYHPGATFSAEPVSTARAAAELLTCLLNARNLPRGGLHRVIDLCRQTPATRLRYSGLQEFADWLDARTSGPCPTLSPALCQSA